MKVLRVWVGAQSETDLKGTTITAFPDVERSQICNGDQSCYDPTVLNLLDELMVEAHSYGIKVRFQHF